MKAIYLHCSDYCAGMRTEAKKTLHKLSIHRFGLLFFRHAIRPESQEQHPGVGSLEEIYLPHPCLMHWLGIQVMPELAGCEFKQFTHPFFPSSWPQREIKELQCVSCNKDVIKFSPKHADDEKKMKPFIWEHGESIGMPIVNE